MAIQISELIIIDNKEYSLLCEPLSGYIANRANLDSDKECTATWELIGNIPYLINIEGYVNGKAVDLNYLLPDLPNIYPYWFTGNVDVVLKKTDIYYNDLVVEIIKGKVSKVILNQFLTEESNKVIISEIKKESIIELINSLQRMYEDNLDSGWRTSYMYGNGIDEYETYPKLKDFVPDNIDLQTIKLLETMRSYPNYFRHFLPNYYPFTKEQLRGYSRCFSELQWVTELSYNEFLEWDEELLLEFKDKWNWVDMNYLFQEKGILINDIIEILENEYDDNGIIEILKEFEIKSRDIDVHNDVVKIDSLFGDGIKDIRHKNSLYQPGELEDILVDVEKYGKEMILSGEEVSGFGHDTDFFMFDNPLSIGVDYTFNTPEKRKMLDDAVDSFFQEQVLIAEMRDKMK